MPHFYYAQPQPNQTSTHVIKMGRVPKLKKNFFLNRTSPGIDPRSTGREILYMLRKKHEFVVVTDSIQNGGQIGEKFKTGGLYVSSTYFLN